MKTKEAGITPNKSFSSIKKLPNRFLKILSVILLISSFSLQHAGAQYAPTATELNSIGVLNASSYPGVVGDGITDVSNALLAAIDEAYTSQKVLLLESGTYLVSKQLLFKQDFDNKKYRAHQFIGSTTGARPVILLKSGSADFQIPSNSKAVIRFMCEDDPDRPTDKGEKPSINFNQGIRNIDIRIEDNNPGANGIHFTGAQQCFIEDVKITMNSGFAGIYEAPGTSVVLGNIEIENGQYGIYMTEDPTACFQNITLKNQSVAAIFNSKWVFPTVFTGLHIIKDMAPAIILDGGSHSQSWAKSSVTIVDGIIEFAQESEEPAIDNRTGKALTLHNVFFLNAGTIVKGMNANGNIQSSVPASWSCVKEFGYTVDDASGVNFINGVLSQDKTLSLEENAGAPDLSLITAHGWDIDRFPSPDAILAKIKAGDTDYAVASALFDPEHPVVPQTIVYGNSMAGNDVTTNLQWLIDNYQTVLIPRGRFLISRPLQLRPDSRIIGVGNHISQIGPIDTWVPTSAEYIIKSPDDPDATSTLFNLKILVSATCTESYNGNWFGHIDWMAGRYSVVKNTHCQSLNSSLTICANNFSRIWIHKNGGGTWYNCDAIGNHKGSYGTQSRIVLIEGTTEPLVVYNMCIEDGAGDYKDNYQFEIRNSANISIYGFKSENSDDIYINETSTEDGIQTKNICFFGIGGMAEITIIHPDDILMSNVLTRNYTHPESYAQYGIKEVFGSSTTIIERIKPVAIYKRGNPTWLTSPKKTQTGIRQSGVSKIKSLKLYPNPTTGKFLVDHEIERLEVFNIHGKRIIQQACNDVDISNNPAGYYTVRVNDRNNTYHGKVLLIQDNN